MKELQDYSLIQMGRWITAVVIIFGCAGLLCYDIWVLATYGPETTVSAMVNAWAYSYLGDQMNYAVIYAFGFLNGAAVVHFLGWAPILDDKTVNTNYKNKEFDKEGMYK